MSARSPRAGAKRVPPPRPTGDGTERLYSIGELAQELEVTTRAIRFYEAKGLIAPVRRGVHRSYSRRDRARLRLILRGKNLGFTLEEVAQYLRLYERLTGHTGVKSAAASVSLKVGLPQSLEAARGSYGRQSEADDLRGPGGISE